VREGSLGLFKGECLHAKLGSQSPRRSLHIRGVLGLGLLMVYCYYEFVLRGNEAQGCLKGSIRWICEGRRFRVV
jgi:hypothetical protein